MSDCISRQDAIDVIDGYMKRLCGYIGTPNDTESLSYARGLLIGVTNNIMQLPSAVQTAEQEWRLKMGDLINRQDAIKAYTASDRNGDTGYSIVVFAETAGKAKAYAANSDYFDAYDFTEIRVNRRKELDRFYKGKREMDWMNDDDRVAMVRYANYECASEVWHPECETGNCPAQEWCGRYERMKE